MKKLLVSLLFVLSIGVSYAAQYVPIHSNDIYNLRQDVETGELDLWLSDHIDGTGKYIPLLNYLDSRPPVTVNLHLIGYGGSATAYSLLTRSLAKHNVVVHVHGSLYSAHAMLLCSADKTVIFYETSVEIMYHGVQGGKEADAKAYDKLWTGPTLKKQCVGKTLTVTEINDMLRLRNELYIRYPELVKRLKANGIKVITK